MRIPVPEAAGRVEAAGMLRRSKHDQSDLVIPYVSALLGRPLPPDLEAFYREHIYSIGDFWSYIPWWSEWMKRWEPVDPPFTDMLKLQAVPLFSDGCGSVYGVDLSSGDEAVYFYDHEDGFTAPRWAAGSSLGAFLLLLADSDRAIEEEWPPNWRLAIDPDIINCRLAPMGMD
ncbi:hypothetical protein BH10PSE5_BH10PSE5_12840 [soil metagenome]